MVLKEFVGFSRCIFRPPHEVQPSTTKSAGMWETTITTRLLAKVEALAEDDVQRQPLPLKETFQGFRGI